MEEIILSVVRDLPSTGILILFVWFTSKQFNKIVEMLGEHLAQINKIMEQCIRSKNVEEQEKRLEVKLHEADHMIDTLRAKMKEQRESQGLL